MKRVKAQKSHGLPAALLLIPQFVLAIEVNTSPAQKAALKQETPKKTPEEAASEQPVNFALKKGKQYSLCNDFFVYLKQNYAFRSEFAQTAFSAKSEVFSTPTYTPLEPKKGLRIDMQLAAYSRKGLYGAHGWLKSLNRYEQRFKDMQFFTTKIDLNNDGKTDKVQMRALYSLKGKYQVFSNFPLNRWDNIAVDWFEKQRVTTIGGELFLYQGRTFTLKQWPWALFVNEPKESPMRDSGGIIVTKGVCEITL
ncbi:hypothetical protein [Thalassomonas actiniarum]|uniref:Uncharacterized protein n=1 Tax=Thalassomonas actiniarum TaxID=485447 RepID=A0AAE9YX92_9GAMM|nr:hypothetical protein [Thalassomonas actiniarum]WDE02583.1 hypothetical protein SG35_029710 [Thalassomonas actiniarum]